MAKNKTEIHVTTVFDGELDATDVLSLIHILSCGCVRALENQTGFMC